MNNQGHTDSSSEESQVEPQIEPHVEPTRPTRRRADQSIAETCLNQDSVRRTRSGQIYSAPDPPTEPPVPPRNTPVLRPRHLRSVQFEVDTEDVEATEPREVPCTDPRRHQTQLDPRDMTLTMVDRSIPPQPIGTSTPAESLNLEAIHRDTQNLLQDL